MFDDEILSRARAVLDGCRAAGLRLTTAESLTGGLIAAALTEIPGASDVVDRAFVVYSYDAKSQMLGVPYDLVERCGAVSEAVARAMAEGALAHAHPRSHLAVAVTGVAGPGPNGDNPAGLVHLACARRGGRATLHARREFGAAGRAPVRRATVLAALDLLLEALAT